MHGFDESAGAGSDPGSPGGSDGGDLEAHPMPRGEADRLGLDQSAGNFKGIWASDGKETARRRAGDTGVSFKDAIDILDQAAPGLQALRNE
jgi:hypothetical protein